MNKRHLYLLAGGLCLLGVLLFLYKVMVLDFPLIPKTRTTVWNIEAHLSFVTANKPIKISMFLPRNSRRFAIVNENFISKGFGFNVVTEDGKRKVNWSIRRSKGVQSLYYRATVRRMDREVPPIKPIESHPKKPDFKGAHLEASEALISEAHEKSADIDGIVTELLYQINKPKPDENVALLLGKNAADQKKVDLAVQLLALTGVHSRSVHGIRLEGQQRNTPLIHWLEVYNGKTWVAYNPVNGQRGIPEDYLAWWRGIEPLVQAQGVRKFEVFVSTSRSEEAAIESAIEKGKIKQLLLLEFSLFSLPIQTQAVYHVILLVPVGVLLLVILRNVIGFRTFGTFMPVLIALAFRETQLLWGVFLFTTLVAIGLMIRLYLEYLKLLVVPRLAAILIIVIFLMATFSIFTHKLGLERGLSVALFPMVILTMTIERMSIVWEELGAFETIKQGIGSIIAAVLAYLVMTIKYIEHLMFVFPELLLILLAITLLLGRYSGYRLLELQRFKALTEMKSDV